MQKVLRRLLLLVLLTVTCVETPSGPNDSLAAPNGSASLTIHLTDAPGDIKAAVVTIAQVYLQGTGGRTVLLNTPYTVDLVSLAATSTVLLDNVRVPAGIYPELRFVVSGAYIAVEQPSGGTRIFASAPNYAGLPPGTVVDGQLQLPSLGTSGLKVQLPDGGLKLPTSGEMSLQVDFDVAQSFGQQAGNSGMWVMHPVITATDITQGTTLTATLALGTGATLPAGVTVGDFQATLAAANAPGQILASAAFSPDGSGGFRAALGFVAPGSYLVNVVVPSAATGVTVSPSVPVAFTAVAGPGTTLAFTLSSTAGVASQIAANAGDKQSATVNTAVTVAPSVIVRDQLNNPVSGVAVTFAVATGGGSVTGSSQTTNTAGIATVGSWTLGQTAGPNTLTATATGAGIAGNPVTFTATGTAGAATQIAPNAGNNQSAVVNTAVTTPPSVIVRDQFNNPVSGVVVTFTVASGNGSITGGSQTTNASGIATVGSWTLGQTAGANTLTATATGTGITGNPVTFTGTGTAGAATQIAPNAGDKQSAPVNTALATPPSVIVRDQFNNPVSGVVVTFAVASGNGSITGGSQTTGANGIATVGSWTVGQRAGANTLTATATGAGITGNPVTFNATGSAGAATQIAPNGGNNQSAAVNTAVTTPPSVIVRDQFNNPVSGVVVTFTATGGGGSVSGSTQNTNAAGIATVGSWTVGQTVGTNSLTATATGAGIAGNPVTFTATGTAGAATQIAPKAGDNQSAAVNTAVAIAPSVIVSDQFGNPVSGVVVTFNVTGGGGNVTGGSQTTNTAGIATVGSWTLGQKVGTNSLSASATGTGITGNPVPFTATGTAGVATLITVEAGDNQSAPVNTAVAIAPAVIVSDQFGNPVSGVVVTFTVTGGGGSVTGGSQTTNTAGIAAVGSWTLGQTAGTNTLTATATGAGITGNPVTFTATGTAVATPQVVVTPPTPTLAAFGATEQFTAQELDASGKPVTGVTFSWASSNTAVATVDANGLATAVANGSTTISASVGTLTGTTTLTVQQAVATVAVTPPTATLAAVGATQQFAATASDANGHPLVTQPIFTWTSSTPSAATVDATGLATAVANGSTTITARVGNVNGTASLTVLQAVTTVNVTPAAATLTALGATQQFTAQALDAKSHPLVPQPAFTWSSSDPTVTTVNQTGLATALKNGTATITATADGVPGTASLSVNVPRGTIVWTNSNGGNWGLASNWNLNRLPVASDTILIGIDGSYTVTLDVDAEVAHLTVGVGSGARTLAIASHTLTVDDSAVFTTNGTLALSGGTVMGAGAVSVAGTLTWTGGTLAGTGATVVTPGATLNISGTATKTLGGRPLTNQGTATWSGTGGVVASNGAVFSNLAGASFEAQGSAIFSDGGGARSSFANTGVFHKTGVHTHTTFSVSFDNDGTVDVASGRLDLSGLGNHNGAFIVTDSLVFSTINSLSASSSVSGAGTVWIVGATTTFGGAYAVTGTTAVTGGTADFSTPIVATTASLIVTGFGRLAGSGTVIVGSSFTWAGTGGTPGGTLVGTGTTRVESGATLTMCGFVNLFGRRLENAGTATWVHTCGANDTFVAVNGAVFNNLAGATFEAEGAASYSVGIGSSGLTGFANAGMFHKTGAGTTTSFGSGFAFNNTGVVDVASGTLSFSGALNHQAGATIEGQGTLTVPSTTFTNAGIVSPGESPGILSVTGNYPTSSTAVLNIELGGTQAGTAYDQLAVSGTAALGGTLNVTLINGFAPPAGQQFTIMTYAAKTGAFATVNLPPGFTLNVTPTAVIATAGQGPRPVVTWAAPVSGDWGDATKWSPARVPTAADSALITTAGAYAVSVTTGAQVGYLTVGGPGSTPTLNVSAGTVTLDTAAFATGSTLSLAGGTLASPAVAIVAGQLNWTGGTINGRINVLAGATWALQSDANPSLNGGRVDNAGTATWSGSGSGSGLCGGNGAVINNLAGGTFEAQSDAILYAPFGCQVGGAVATFNNSGTFRKTGGTGTTNVGWTFTNSGAVEVQTGTVVYSSLALGGSFSVAAGAVLDLSGADSRVAAHSSVTGAGTVQLGGGGTLTLDPNVVLDVNAILALSGGTVTGAGVVNIGGRFNWTAGTLNGRVNVLAGAMWALQTDLNPSLNGGRVDNAGTATWSGSGSGSGLCGGNGAVINNLAGATFEAQSDAILYPPSGCAVGGAVATFNNSGTFRKTSGTGTTSVGWTFTNSGAVEVQTGTLLLGGATTGGSFAAASGAVLALGASSSNLTSVSGPGQVLVSNGGGVTFSGSYNVTGVTEVAGGGTATFETADTARTGALVVDGGALGGTAPVKSMGSFSWTSGMVQGVVVVAASATWALQTDLNPSLNGGRVDNAGIATWSGSGSGSGLCGGNGGAINNLAGATFEAQSDAILYAPSGCGVGGAVATFNNSGTFRKTGGTGTTTVGWTFTNSGAVEVQTGTVAYSTLALGGSVSVATGAILDLSGADSRVAAHSSVTGAGTVQLVGGGTLTVDPNAMLDVNAILALSGGTVTGAGVVNVGGRFNWTAGTLSGRVNVLAGAMWALQSDANPSLNGGRVDNAGAATWSGSGSGSGLCGGNGAVINNLAGATFEAQSDAILYAPFGCGVGGAVATFNNSGTFRKTGGTGTTTVGWTFSNSGLLDIATGSVQFAALSHETGAILQGAGTLDVSGGGFTNAGIVSPGESPGMLSVTGDYPTAQTSVLNIEVGGVNAGTDYDQLAVSGTATIGGTLNMTLINGFAPASGTQFTVVTCAVACTGDFATVNLPPGFTHQVTSTAVIVTKQ